MPIIPKREPIILLFGDIIIFFLALWLTLLARYAELPSEELFRDHAIPFSLLFVVWLAVFFIAGLYDKHTTPFKLKLPGIILNTQVINIIIAALFFFLIPVFGIAPKTNLVIYLIISFFLIVVWRLFMFPRLGIRKRHKTLLLGSGKEVEELREEIEANSRYNLDIVYTADLAKTGNPNDLQKEMLELVGPRNVTVIVCDTSSKHLEPLLPFLYNLTFLNTSFHFIDIVELYEDIFDRVPLSLLRYDWFLENVSHSSKTLYEGVKRIIDVILALPVGLVTLLILPFVYAAIWLEGAGPIFITQERIGKNNRPIHVHKFRTMDRDDKGDEVLKSRATPTRIGVFLRASRIDELPQIWNVLKGDLSLIGPRPEFPVLAHRYAERIPYYNTRHLIKPGLSGWGQINDYDVPRKVADIERTRRKLSYDLYYVKNRSLMLDIHIILKTIKTILSRSGT